ncbi:MAG: hypothetical protein PHV23_00485 [Candidatus Gracilibacteria bacterium]|nr:hypothetical protein [Candidatus Gracilibacteria bacterium]
MKLGNALFLSSALLLGQANAAIDQEKTAVANNSETTRVQVTLVKSNIDTILNELEKIKKECILTGKTESKKTGGKEYNEIFKCDKYNGVIKTEITNSRGKVNIRGANYTCSDLKTSLKINQLITLGNKISIIDGNGAVLENSKGSLLMSESCSDIISYNK